MIFHMSGAGESLVPSGHAGVTHPCANGVEDVPLGIVGRIGDQVRRRRIEGIAERGGLAIEASVAQGAIHGVELHTVDQVLIGGRERDWLRGGRDGPLRHRPRPWQSGVPGEKARHWREWGTSPGLRRRARPRISATSVTMMPKRNLPMRPPAIFWQSGGQERQCRR